MVSDTTSRLAWERVIREAGERVCPAGPRVEQAGLRADVGKIQGPTEPGTLQ